MAWSGEDRHTDQSSRSCSGKLHTVWKKKGIRRGCPKHREQQGQGNFLLAGGSLLDSNTGRGWVSRHTECGHRDRHLKRPMRGVCADPGQAFRIKQKSDAIGFPCKHAPLASGCMSVQRKAGRLASRDCNDAARDQEAMKWAPGTGPRHLFRVPSVCAPQNS